MSAREAWAASGAMALTGDADGLPLVAPDGIVERIRALGAPIGIDALTLLGERAAIAGLSRRGATSCGGATRLLPAADGGWVAVALVRPDDVDLLPAWLGVDDEAAVPEAIAARDAVEVVAAGRELGLPVARLGEVADPGADPVLAHRLGEAAPLDRPPRVVDLTSLWAGPVCARALGERGAAVVKVESSRRPDGARRGPPAFFERLHAGHEQVALDFASADGVAALRELLVGADVVLEASRPRALEQLGIDAAALVRGGGPRVWLSITGHGRAEPGRHAVAFGDDATVAGGLVARPADGRPRFVADAVADPLSGVAAAVAVSAALEGGGRWLLDAALARVAAHVAGPDRDAPWLPGNAQVRAPEAPGSDPLTAPRPPTTRRQQ